MDRKKVENIINRPLPKSIVEVQSLIGCVNYYRKHVPNFTWIATPLYRMIATGKFYLDEECTNVINILKEYLSSQPLIAHPDWEKEFKIFVDTSKISIGYVLAQTQKGREVSL